jgi:hypothetical protein
MVLTSYAATRFEGEFSWLQHEFRVQFCRESTIVCRLNDVFPEVYGYTCERPGSI